MPAPPSTRRSFFGLAGGAALLCTIGGEQIDLAEPNGLERADAAAARVKRPTGAVAQNVPQIQPAPGGTRREYWLQAEPARWAITPKGKDEWHNKALGGRNVFTAFVYRPMTPGFASYLIDHPTIPGPALHAEVPKDTLVIRAAMRARSRCRVT